MANSKIDSAASEGTEYAFGIVGLGPCGLMAAIKMGQKLALENPDKKIVVFEKRDTPLRQQGVKIREVADFIISLGSSSEQDTALINKLNQLSDEGINIKDLESFLLRKLKSMPNVDIVYLAPSEELDIKKNEDQHYISLVKNDNTRRDYNCRHIIATDGAHQHSLKCIEKNFAQPIINITSGEPTYHASIQLTVDPGNRQQPSTAPQTSTKYTPISCLILDRRGGSSKKQKYSVTMKIPEELYNLQDPERKDILLEMAKKELVREKPTISIDTLVLAQSKKNPNKKNRLAIIPFRYQKQYCHSSVILLHPENQDLGVCLPLGNARKTPNYQRGVGIKNAYEDVQAATDCFDFKTLHFDSRRYESLLVKNDEEYMDDELVEKINQKVYAAKQVGTPGDNLQRWIKEGLIHREQGRLTFYYNAEIQTVFKQEHKEALRNYIKKEKITQVCINCVDSKQFDLLSEILDVAVEEKCANTLSLKDLGYVDPKDISFLYNHGQDFQNIEVTIKPFHIEEWKQFFNRIIDDENSHLQSLVININDGTAPNVFYSENLSFALMLFLKQIKNSQNQDPKLLGILKSFVDLSSVKNHNDLLKIKEVLFEMERTNPTGFYEQLTKLRNALPNKSPLQQHIASISKLVQQRIQAINNYSQQYLKEIPSDKMKLDLSEKKMTLQLSSKFPADDDHELLAMLQVAQKYGISTLVITMPHSPSGNIIYMDGPARIIKLLDTEYGKGIKNLVIKRDKPEMPETSPSYYISDFASKAKDALLKHGKYLEKIQIACKKDGNKAQLFEEVGKQFKDNHPEVIICNPNDPQPSNFENFKHYKSEHQRQIVPSENAEDKLKTQFMSKHKEYFIKAQKGIFGCFRRTKVLDTMSLQEIITHAQKANNRSRKVCIELGWMRKNGDIIDQKVQNIIQNSQNNHRL